MLKFASASERGSPEYGRILFETLEQEKYNDVVAAT